MYDPLIMIMVMINSTSMNLVNVLVRFNQLLWYFCSFPHIQYRHPPSHLPSPKKKNQRFRKYFFFSFHLRCCKNENLWWFSPYPVNTAIIWPTTDRIPHSLIFKRMQIKWIADNIRAFSLVLTNWNKEPDKQRIYRWGEFFHKLDNKKWKMRTGARARKQKYISIYIYISLWKPFWKRVYIYIYIYSRQPWLYYALVLLLSTLSIGVHMHQLVYIHSQ